MSKKKQKTKKKTEEDLAPENFKTQTEAEEAAEEYITSQPIYNYFQFFIGGPNNIDKNKQQGKPKEPPY